MARQHETAPVALITGGGSGINLAFAKVAFAGGYSIIISDLRLHPLAKEWIEQVDSQKSLSRSRETPRVIYQQTDVTQWSQIEAAFDRSEAEFGTCPDLVVPGAGVYEPSSNSFWADSDHDNQYLILSINLTHPIKTSRIAIRRMLRAKKPGTIVHVSSIAGQRTTIVTPLYTVSKHGINAFVRGMGALQDLAGIRVVGVAPG
jgi:3-hydroxybutyrate dehydrogenase